MPFAYYQTRSIGLSDPRFGAARVLSARAEGRLETLNPGVEDIRKDSDFVPTPMSVVELMVAEATVLKERQNSPFPTRCLEPSAGSGRIARALLATDNTEVDVVELHPERRRELAAAGMRLVGEDFLKFSPATATLARKRGYDCIMMNPPFSNAQYIEHLKHAQGMLRPGGNLVSIVPHYIFKRPENRDWFMSMDHAKCTQLSRNHFKAQNVDIATHILTIKEPTSPMVSHQSPADYAQERTQALMKAADLALVGSDGQVKAGKNLKSGRYASTSNGTEREVSQLLDKATLVVNDVIPDLLYQMSPAERSKTTFISRNTPRIDTNAKLGGTKLLEHAPKRTYDRIVLANFSEPDRMMDELHYADGVLAPGGKIVIMAPETLFDPKDSRSEGFFKWLEAHRTFEAIKLPSHRSFPDSRLIIVENPISERLVKITTGTSGFFMPIPKTATTR